MALQLIRNTRQLLRRSKWSGQIKLLNTEHVNTSNDQMIDLPDDSNIKLPIPTYADKINEPIDRRKARLLYQSRKRGMLENGLLLSTFAAKYLDQMSLDQVEQYDRLINLPSNDWDIYYWSANLKETPEEYDNEVMGLLKAHVQNKDREARLRQPDLYSAEPGEDLYRHINKIA